MIKGLKGQHFLSTADLAQGQFQDLVDLGLAGKKDPGLFGQPLLGKSVGLIFFNASLRTRTSMAVAVHQLGGFPVILDVGAGVWNLETEDGAIMMGDKPEHIKEAIPVLARYVDLLGVRCFSNLTDFAAERTDPLIHRIAELAGKPVINLESAVHHPCQALADMMTITERLGQVRGKRVVLSWAPHPKPLPMAVPNSFALAACQLGAHVTIAHPKEFALDAGFTESWRQLARAAGGSLSLSHNQEEAFQGAQVVYAKSWGALPFYGRWAEEAQVRKDSFSWTVTEAKMANTDQGLFMHCLPVRRNVVVADEVLDGPRSVVLDEAENRLHGQKAILAALMS